MNRAELVSCAGCDKPIHPGVDCGLHLVDRHWCGETGTPDAWFCDHSCLYEWITRSSDTHGPHA